jgi:hypothetical protein
MVKILEFTQEPNDSLPFDVVDDIQQYMKNDPAFYRRIYYPTMCKMQECGESENPKDLVAPMALLAARNYVKKYKINKVPEELLTAEEMDDLVNRVYEEEIEACNRGEY